MYRVSDDPRIAYWRARSADRYISAGLSVADACDLAESARIGGYFVMVRPGPILSANVNGRIVTCDNLPGMRALIERLGSIL